MIEGHYTVESGRQAMGQLWDRCSDLTAVFVVSDEMAIGAMHALRERNLEIPRDVSVLGFDGIDIIPYLSPPLSSVQQPIRTIGEKAAELLLRLMEGEEPGERRLVIPHTIVQRDSCRRL